MRDTGIKPIDTYPRPSSSSMRRTLRFTAASGPSEKTFLMMMLPVNEAHITIALAHGHVTRHDPQRAHAVHAALIDAVQTGDMTRFGPHSWRIPSTLPGNWWR